MIHRPLVAAVASWSLLLCATASRAQGGSSDVYWHIDPNVRTCSMVIDPSLTQAQWRSFTRQVGALSSFKTLSSAKPLGRMNVQVAVDYGTTPVDQHDHAWINTFTHPDADCPLGDAIAYPALRARIGVSDQVDVGGSWTMAPRANYGLVGAEVRYAFLRESGKLPAAAARASVAALTGVPDFNMSIYSLDATVSKGVARVIPYLGMRTSLAVGTETTSKVDLHAERVAIAQGYAGLTCRLWGVHVAAEYDASTVNTFALAVGHGF
jgi:hypothetical protein